MATYRKVWTRFWQEAVGFTPEERYFALYLLTNQRTTLCGVYHLPISVIDRETGYNKKAVTRLLMRMDAIRFASYDLETEEVMVVDWILDNAPVSPQQLAGVNGELASVRSAWLVDLYRKRYKEVLGHEQSAVRKRRAPEPKVEDVREQLGQFVRMTKGEIGILVERYGEPRVLDYIERLDNYIGSKGAKYKSHYRTLLVWLARDKVKEVTKSNGPKVCPTCAKPYSGTLCRACGWSE